MKQAKEHDLKHIIHLNNVLLGSDHAIISMPKYDMDLRQYLRDHRDFRELNKLLLMVGEGLKELHAWDMCTET